MKDRTLSTRRKCFAFPPLPPPKTGDALPCACALASLCLCWVRLHECAGPVCRVLGRVRVCLLLVSACRVQAESGAVQATQKPTNVPGTTHTCGNCKSSARQECGHGAAVAGGAPCWRTAPHHRRWQPLPDGPGGRRTRRKSVSVVNLQCTCPVRVSVCVVHLQRAELGWVGTWGGGADHVAPPGEVVPLV